MELRAKVIFHDGFDFSPTIQTHRGDLKGRLENAILVGSGAGVSGIATAFTTLSSAVDDGEVETGIFNSPIGMSVGITMARLHNRAFWPGDGSQAGVFIVDLSDMENAAVVVDVIGGVGFHGMDEINPNMPTKVELNVGGEGGPS